MVFPVTGTGNRCTCGVEGNGPKIVGGTPAAVFKLHFKKLYNGSDNEVYS
jgi:hypothetical protein